MLGYSNEEIKKLKGKDIHSEKDLPYVVEQFEKQLTGERPLATNMPVKRKDGSIFYADINSFEIILKKQQYLVGVFRDNTERKQAEESLRESEEQFRTVADFTYDWEYWIAPDGRYLYVSPSCERITGYNSDEFLNDPGLLEKIVHPDDQSTFVTHLRKTEQREGAFDLDFRIITRDGKERWINHVCQPVYGSDGGYLGQRASNRDISKQKLMQEELLKTKKT